MYIYIFIFIYSIYDIYIYIYVLFVGNLFPALPMVVVHGSRLDIAVAIR